jgi:hypothetical protein
MGKVPVWGHSQMWPQTKIQSGPREVPAAQWFLSSGATGATGATTFQPLRDAIRRRRQVSKTAAADLKRLYLG